ncbi:EVE domain-containing protein [Calidifontibacter sp. DB0510]|uniref:EVE domain-containing protein n=1 Tax=Metallococcus carri TaxID=1656884 RepID=A0A967E9P7_9MICO|nr:EVE domain-containing protein [Metallococcus carri]NHN56597.1 EVE domain-containing protein [Metallococcus carri]NOP38896.1 EVE domain-containing protein [Calidifontibacter sp. DB2511S]
MSEPRTWVIVASRDHARRGVEGGFIMANHGKRAPVARMSLGDRVLVYSPTTTYPEGKPLRAITIVGEVTGADVEPSTVIEGGYRRAAMLREITPITLAEIRHLLPTSRIRYGFFELPTDAAEEIWSMR